MDSNTFWKKLIFLCFCLVILDFSIGKVLEFLYFKQKKGKLYNVTYVLEQQTCDVLVLGSSKAMHQYNPKIISDSLNLSCYNAGYDGQGILYSKAVLDVVIERYIPKVIILDIVSIEFCVTFNTSYDMLHVLNPYAKKHPVLWETLSLKSKTERIKHFSSIYPYNSMPARIIAGLLPGETKDVTEDGFTPQFGIWNEEIKETIYADSKLDENKTKAFEDIYRICSENNISLYVVVSPIFSIIPNKTISFLHLEQTCRDLNIPFFNFVNDKDYLDNELFLDIDHLNSQGADIFSKDLSHKILNFKQNH